MLADGQKVQFDGVTKLLARLPDPFRQDGLDWQVWIQLGDYPLPRKVVLTTLTDEARPQYVATFTWNLAPSFNEAAFSVVPPKDFGRVLFHDLKK